MSKSRILSGILVLMFIFAFSSLISAAPITYDGVEMIIDGNTEIGSSGSRISDIGILIKNGSKITFNGNLGPIYTTDTGLFIDNSIVVINKPVLIDVSTTMLENDYGVYITDAGGGNSDVTFGDNLKINMAFTAAASSNVGPRAALAIDLNNGTEAVLNVGNDTVITTTAPSTIGRSGDGLFFKADNNSKISATLGDRTEITIDHTSANSLRINSFKESDIEVIFGDNTKLINSSRTTTGIGTNQGIGLYVSASDSSKAKVLFADNTLISGDGTAMLISTTRYGNTVEMSFGDDTHIETYSPKVYSATLYATMSNTNYDPDDPIITSSISMVFGDRTILEHNGKGGYSNVLKLGIEDRLKDAYISAKFGDGTVIRNNSANTSTYSHVVSIGAGSDLSEIVLEFGNDTKIEAYGSDTAAIYLHTGGKSSKNTLKFGNRTTLKLEGDTVDIYYPQAAIYVYSYKQGNNVPVNSVSTMTFGDNTNIEVKGKDLSGILIFADDTAPDPNISMEFGDNTTINATKHGIGITDYSTSSNLHMKFGNVLDITTSAGHGIQIYAVFEKAKTTMEFADKVNINAGSHGMNLYITEKLSQISLSFGDEINIESSSTGINIGVALNPIDANRSVEDSKINLEFGNKVNIKSGSNGINIGAAELTLRPEISMKFGNNANIISEASGIAMSTSAEGSNVSMNFGDDTDIEAGFFGSGISMNVQASSSKINLTFGDRTGIHVTDNKGFDGITINMTDVAEKSELSMKFGKETNIKSDGIMEGINITNSAKKSKISLAFGEETEIKSASSTGITINITDTAKESVVSMDFSHDVNIEADYIGINVHAQAESSKIDLSFGNNIDIKSNTSYGMYASANAKSSEIDLKIGADLYLEGSGIYATTGANMTSSKVSVSLGNGAKLKSASSHGIYFNSNADSSEITATIGNLLTIDAGRNGILAWAKGSSSIQMSVGDNADISTANDSGYGVRALTANTATISIEFGDNLKVTTLGASAHGFLYDGGAISLGKNAVIHVSGDSADIFYFNAGTFSPISFENMTATSKKSNLIYNRLSSTLDLSFIGASKLYGDLRGLNANSGISLSLKGTTIWEGGTAANNLGTIDVTMTKDSAWYVNKSSTVNSIDLGHGLLSFKADTLGNSYYTVKTGKLEGSGNIEMNVDMANTPEGNFLEVIGDATGDYTVKVNHTNISNGGELQLVGIGGNGDANFTLSGNPLAIGDYYYNLSGEANNTEWWLRVKAFDPGSSFTSASLGLMQFARGLDRILFDEFKRTHNGLWMMPFYNKQSFDKDIVKGFQQDIWGIFIGSDKVNVPHEIDEYGKMYFGLFGGISGAHQKFNNGGDGNIYSASIGTYVDYESYKEFHIAGYIRYVSYAQKVNAYSTKNELFEGNSFTHGLNAGVDIVKTFKFDNGIYLEPKAKLSWVGINDYEYNIAAVKAVVSEGGGLQARVGSRIGYTFNDCDESTHEYYIDLGFAHSAGTGGVLDLNDGVIVDLTVGKNRFEIGIGSSYTDLSNNRWFTDIKYSVGDGMKDIKVILGGSWPF